ncbi:hypothetical protein [Rhodanobacter sp. FW106-PBR-R2A-1-13]|uniref:hypothetical protein n=1 Tax=Rhodanobacter sp. FW106-PBR-R2A-1-13 TaxID=3454845 RepID=UPI0034E57F37
MKPATADTGRDLVVAQPAPVQLARGAVIGLAAWSVVVAVASALATSYVCQQRMEAALALRPPIVVVDPFDWIRNAGQGDTPEERYHDGAKRLRAAVDQLTEKGALVIDGTAVRGTPSAVRLSVPAAEGRR